MYKVFLGRPPASIEAWIKGQRPVPPAQQKTVFWVEDVEQEPILIEGPLDQQWFSDHGYYDQNYQYWIKDITKAEIGSKVTSIGDNAFYQCQNLASVTIGNSVTSIGGAAFAFCSNLDSITIPNSVTSIGDNAFQYGLLNSVTIGNSVTSIGEAVFQYCYFDSITIPDSVTSIGSFAFQDCYNLTSIEITHKTMDDVENMITGDRILGYEDYSGKTIEFTCKNGKIDVYYDLDNWRWVIERTPFN